MSNTIKSATVIPALTVAILVVVYAVTGTNSKERQIRNQFHIQGKSIPAYVKIDSSSDEKMFVTYGLGGKTCKSILTEQEDKTLLESNQRCYF